MGLKASSSSTQGTSTPSQLGSLDAGITIHADVTQVIDKLQFDCPQSPVANEVGTFFQTLLSVEDGGLSKVLSTLKEADEFLSEDENDVTEGSASPLVLRGGMSIALSILYLLRAVRPNEVAQKGSSGGGTPTSNVLVEGMTTPTMMVKEPPMVTTTI